MAAKRSRKREDANPKEPLTVEQRRENVLENYEELRQFYQDYTLKYARLHIGLQITTLVGTALTPLLLLFEIPDKVESSAKFIQALPSAIAGLAAALNSSFRYKQEWAQAYATLSALVNERQRFDAATSPDYNKSREEAIDNLQNRMSEIVMAEVTAWKTGLLAADVSKKKL